MRLYEARIQNFKCFVDSTFHFPERFTAVIGDNGAGKSALLDALAIIAGGYLLGLDGAESRGLRKGEIRRSYDNPDNFQRHFPVKLEAVRMDINGEDASGWRSKDSDSKSLTLKYVDCKAKSIAKKHSELIESKQEITLPLLAYHGTGRLWTERRKYKANSKQKKGAKSGEVAYMSRGMRADGYFASLDAKSSKEMFLSWFKTFEDNALKFGRDKTLYHALTEKITQTVPEWQKIHFSWYDDDMMGLFETETESTWRPLSQLSDGYRAFVSLVADLAWRCIQLNPHLGSDVVNQTPGLVLIDELDMHLHPKWQQRVVEILKEAFPLVQFIVTTHSPVIFQSLKPGEVLNLENKPLAHSPENSGLEENALYMGLPSVKSAKFERKRQIAADFIALTNKAANYSEKERKPMIEELNNMLKDFSDDPVFVAKLQFEKTAKLGE